MRGIGLAIARWRKHIFGQVFCNHGGWLFGKVVARSNKGEVSQSFLFLWERKHGYNSRLVSTWLASHYMTRDGRASSYNADERSVTHAVRTNATTHEKSLSTPILDGKSNIIPETIEQAKLPWWTKATSVSDSVGRETANKFKAQQKQNILATLQDLTEVLPVCLTDGSMPRPEVRQTTWEFQMHPMNNFWRFNPKLLNLETKMPIGRQNSQTNDKCFDQH
jgi:hypothetical protein